MDISDISVSPRSSSVFFFCLTQCVLFLGRKEKMAAVRVNLDEPRWDQGTYVGRAKHFFSTTNPLNLLCSSDELDKAKELVDKYK